MPHSDMQKWLTGPKTKTGVAEHHQAIRKLWLVPQIAYYEHNKGHYQGFWYIFGVSAKLEHPL